MKKTIAYILIALAIVGLAVYYFTAADDNANGEEEEPKDIYGFPINGAGAPGTTGSSLQSTKFNDREYSRNPEATLTPAQKFECRQLSGAARQACYDKYNNIPESPVSERISDYLRNNPAPVGANITAKAVLSAF